MARHSMGFEQVTALQQQQQFRTTSKRKCASCGRPTTDYRCEACWNKLRGVGQNGEGRKQKPITNKMQPEPWKPLTALPVAFVPDRQAEFFAKQEAKQKEAAMNTTPETATRTYSVKELAALLGVPAKDISNAKRHPNAKGTPGTKNYAVQQAMQKHGITWEQVQASASATTAVAAQAPDTKGGEAAPQEQAMALEDIIGELRRRLPGATVTISLQ